MSTQPAVVTSATSLTVRRTFKAVRAKVFQAVADRGKLLKWFAPDALDATIHAWDVRTGGRYDVETHWKTGPARNRGVFEEVVTNQRIVMTWELLHTPGGTGTTRVTWVFNNAAGGGCEVVLVHEGFPSRESMQIHADGWVGCLDELQKLL